MDSHKISRLEIQERKSRITSNSQFGERYEERGKENRLNHHKTLMQSKESPTLVLRRIWKPLKSLNKVETGRSRTLIKCRHVCVRGRRRQGGKDGRDQVGKRRQHRPRSARMDRWRWEAESESDVRVKTKDRKKRLGFWSLGILEPKNQFSNRFPNRSSQSNSRVGIPSEPVPRPVQTGSELWELVPEPVLTGIGSRPCFPGGPIREPGWPGPVAHP